MPLLSKKRATEGDVVELLEEVNGGKMGHRAIVISSFNEPSEAYDLEIVNPEGELIGFAYSVRPDQFTNLSLGAFVQAMEAVENGDLARAEMALKAATDFTSDYIGVFVNSILHSFQKPELVELEKNISLLIPLFRMAIRVVPTYEIARTNLAIAFFKFGVEKGNQGNHGEAAELFYSALAIETDEETQSRIKTNMVIALTHLGQELINSGDVVRSFGLIRNAFLIIQDEITTRNLGIAYGNSAVFAMQAGNFDVAIQMFERAEDAGVIVPWLINDYGVCLAVNGRLEEARLAFERALELDRDNAGAKGNLIRLETITASVEERILEWRNLYDQLLTEAERPLEFGQRGAQSLAWVLPDLRGYGVFSL